METEDTILTGNSRGKSSSGMNDKVTISKSHRPKVLSISKHQGPEAVFSFWDTVTELDLYSTTMRGIQFQMNWDGLTSRVVSGGDIPPPLSSVFVLPWNRVGVGITTWPAPIIPFKLADIGTPNFIIVCNYLWIEVAVFGGTPQGRPG